MVRKRQNINPFPFHLKDIFETSATSDRKSEDSDRSLASTPHSSHDKSATSQTSYAFHLNDANAESESESRLRLIPRQRPR
ncbi:hypothetical protein J6590_039501 [Homalodisca vitripennis]|nr:hypothetical protein J6590_039501 [Homalodisca vitripennis]